MDGRRSRKIHRCGSRGPPGAVVSRRGRPRAPVVEGRETRVAEGGGLPGTETQVPEGGAAFREVVQRIKGYAFRYDVRGSLRRAAARRGVPLRRAEWLIRRRHRRRPADSGVLIPSTTGRDTTEGGKSRVAEGGGTRPREAAGPGHGKCGRAARARPREGAGPAGVHPAVGGALPHAWSGEDDGVLGMPFAGRDEPGTGDVVGLFPRVLPGTYGAAGRPAGRWRGRHAGQRSPVGGKAVTPDSEVRSVAKPSRRTAKSGRWRNRHAGQRSPVGGGARDVLAVGPPDRRHGSERSSASRVPAQAWSGGVA
ncbi:hypothetical protein GA0115245_124411 [Streptomyces sp. di188]|nr:hypothetical protein GA0115238_136411 [Streptomyces sp. di50b]SCE16820.1 hypothetical protein GA0115245_124411 [Streptomyces sp. di188]